MGLRRFRDYQLRLEDRDKQWAAGRWNPALELAYHVGSGKSRREVVITLGAGHSDSMKVYREASADGRLYILTTNWSLDYAGLDEHEFLTGDKLGDVFFQGDQVTNTLGDDWNDKSAPWIIKVLQQYLPY